MSTSASCEQWTAIEEAVGVIETEMGKTGFSGVCLAGDNPRLFRAFKKIPYVPYCHRFIDNSGWQVIILSPFARLSSAHSGLRFE